MSRATSKASLLEEREIGRIMSQEDKILEIISIGGDWSMQEIMAKYRAKWGNIEYGSISARCNTLKDPDNPKIFEVGTRKCSISGKVINCLAVKRKKGLGQWQAYVEGGKTKEKQLERYAEVPEQMKEQVKRHMRTVIALKEARCR